MSETFVGRYWKGDGQLAHVFWGYGVIPSTLAALLLLWLGLSGRIGDAAVIAAILLLFAYTLWILVSVWRCAQRRGDNDLYGVMARWLTVAWAINAVLVGGFILIRLLTPT